MRKIISTLTMISVLFIPSILNANEYFTGTLQECRNYISKLDTMIGYPSRETKTLTYAKPRRHAKKALEYLVTVKEVWGPKLKREALVSDINNASTLSERTTKRRSRTILEAEGAFDRTNEPLVKSK